MKKSKSQNKVNDYWQFKKELRGQLNAVHVLEREFFELEELCDWAIKNDVTCLNDNGQRVSVVDDSLGARQSEVYMKLCKVVCDLGDMLEDGKSCFTIDEGE